MPVLALTGLLLSVSLVAVDVDDILSVCCVMAVLVQ